jgi:CBS domain-containing protein
MPPGARSSRHIRELLQVHVRTIMKDHLITAAPDDQLVNVALEIAAHGIGAVPVVDADEQLVGIVSSTELVQLLHDGVKLEDRPVSSVMGPVPASIDEFATVNEAIGLMRKEAVRHLPVTREGKLVGLVTASALIRHLLKNYPSPEVA